MSIILKVILLAFSTLFVLFDIFIFIKCRKFDFKKTGLKVFLLEDYFFLGSFILEKYKSNSNGKRVRKLEEIYDVTTAGQIAKSAAAAPISYALLLTPFLISILAMTENYLAFISMASIIVFLMIYFDFWLENILKVRHEKILKEFSNVLSKMSLLVNAGVTASEALEKVADSSEGVFYDELKRYIEEIENGITIFDALDNLNFRCGCKEVKKFTSLYKQNLIKGGPEFPFLLQDMAASAWDERKNRARLSGSKAEQKLLIPIMLMFTGVLIMIIVPAFNSLL